MTAEPAGVDHHELLDALWFADQVDPTNVSAVFALWQVGQSRGHSRSSSAGVGDLDVGTPLPDEPHGVPESEHANVYTPFSGSDAHWSGMRTLPLLAVPALRRERGLARALRSLKLQVSAPGLGTIDEEVTAARSAEAGRIVPRYRPRTERWLELAVVVDDSTSMGPWRQTARELTALLERHGAFRNVRAWRLRPDEKSRPVLLDPSGREHQVQEIGDPTGRRLVLVITDGVDDLWRNEDAIVMLRQWATNNPIAIVQVLPPSMWHRTGLPTVPVQMCHVRRGMIAPTPLPDLGLPTTAPHRWLPTIGLDATQFDQWAKLLVGDNLGPTPMMAVPLGDLPMPLPVDDSADLSARDRVARFHSTASAVAFDLAGFLSAAPLTVPVMRVVQRAALPDSEPGHLAEVMLSGLVSVIVEATDPDEVIYDFLPDVRDELLRTRSRGDALAVLDAMVAASPLVAGRLGTVDVTALAADPTGHLLRSVHSRAFARVAVTVLGGLGGQYADRAEEIIAALRDRSLHQRRGRSAEVLPRRQRPRPDHAPPAEMFKVDPTAPAFFLSYARLVAPGRRSAGRGVDPTVRRLFDELCDHIVNLAALGPDRAPGVMDTGRSASAGWERGLLRAAGTCQVFVALITPEYVNDSPWCAAEWDLFSRRDVHVRDGSGDPNRTAILPVIWRPVRRFPRSIATVAPFAPDGLTDPRIGALYQVDGLRGLLETSVDGYEAVVWKLALRVQTMLATQWVAPETPLDATELLAGFEPGALRNPRLGSTEPPSRS